MSLSLNLKLGLSNNSGSGASAFAPDDITGLAIGLHADEPSTITEVTSAVSVWADNFAGSYTASQGTAGNRPVVATDSNGLTCIEFDGVDDFLEFSSGLLTLSASDYTMVITTIDTTATGKVIAGSTGGSTNYRVGVRLSAKFDYLSRTSFNPDPYTGTFVMADPNITAIRRTGATLDCYVNGAIDPAPENTAEDVTMTFFGMGANSSGGESANIRVHRVYLYTEYLSDSDLNELCNYIVTDLSDTYFSWSDI